MNAQKDFSKQIIKNLKVKGVKVMDTTWAPDVNGDFSNGETVYRLDDNGILLIRTYSEVIAMGLK